MRAGQEMTGRSEYSPASPNAFAQPKPRSDKEKARCREEVAAGSISNETREEMRHTQRRHHLGGVEDRQHDHTDSNGYCNAQILYRKCEICRIRLVEPENSGQAAAALGTLGRWRKAIVNSQVAPRQGSEGFRQRQLDCLGALDPKIDRRVALPSPPTSVTEPYVVSLFPELRVPQPPCSSRQGGSPPIYAI